MTINQTLHISQKLVQFKVLYDWQSDHEKVQMLNGTTPIKLLVILILSSEPLKATTTKQKIKYPDDKCFQSYHIQ